MPRYLVQLTAPLAELAELREWFQSGDVRLIEKDGSTFLTGPALEAIDNPFEAQRIAGDAVADFATIAEVCMGHLNSPEIAGYFVEDASGRVRQEFFVQPANILQFGRVKQRQPNPVGTTFQERLLQAAHASLHLRTATRLWARPKRSWPRLYRIFEELENHMRGPLPRFSICSESDRTQFKRSANNADVAGDDSRHSHGANPPPPIPMSHSSAEAFVGSCLRDTIRYQAGEFPKSVA